MNPLLRRIKNCDAHHRLFFATAVAIVTALATYGRFHFALHLVITWNAFAVTVLALAWARILTGKASESLKTAKLQDSSRVTIFLFVLATAIASLFAVAYFLGTAHRHQGQPILGKIVLGLGTIIGSWSLIHTLFALHYAHAYYRDGAVASSAATRHAGGLLFPHETMPDYLDFAYFSFVIGMTCQVSDVQITGRGLRGFALLHGLLSFGFNTIILALCINILSGVVAG